MRLKTILVALFIFTCIGNSVYAQGNNHWTPISNGSIAPDIFGKYYKPAIFRSYQLDEAALRAQVVNAPLEGTIHPNASTVIIAVPNAQGEMESYKVVESLIMEKGLADKFPMIKTYLGIGIDNPGATIRFDLTPQGFHASILSPNRKTIYINMIDQATGTCVVFDRNGMATISDDFECLTDESKKAADITPITSSADDGQRRTYRLAVTVNGEFSQACLNGTEPDDAARKAKVMAVLTTNLNRANGIFDRDFGIRMNYVSNMDAIIHLDPNSDPILTTNGSSWNNYCAQIMTGFGNANFDIGHLVGKVASNFRNGSAGCIGCVCSDGGAIGYKGSGFTAHDQVQGDPLVVDFWIHEMGHQFGANHTFSHTTFQQFAGALIEPGSGSTVMGYAGITGGTDVQMHSDDYFHAKSIEQVTDAMKFSAPSSCASITTTGNTTPVVNAGSNYTIPKSTPFMLTGSATDANGDVLSYCWEQYDLLASGSNTIPNSSSTSGPVFRSRSYNTSNTRTFPIMSSILSGANGNTWEALPSVARTLNFRLTVRDHAIVGGANQFDDMQVIVDATTGPFTITAPNASLLWKVGEFQTVTWDVAGTTGGSVNCANVAIELSHDGGNTFPVVLAASTPNDGFHEINVPNNISNQVRVRVRGVGNIFFDVSNINLSIQAASSPEFSFSNPAAVTACAGSPLSVTLNTAALGGFSSPINLYTSGNPAGTSVGLSSSTVSPGSSVTVTLNGTVPAGTHTITVTGISGSVSKTRDISFTVVSPATPPILTTPANAATGQPLTPTFNWAAMAGANNYTLEIANNAGFSPIHTTVAGLNSTSHTISNSLTGNTQYFWRVKAATVCGTLTSTARSFTTANVNCGVLTSTNVPLTILTNVNTVYSTLNVPGSGTITDVDVVGLVGDHDYIEDLTVRLQGPGGTTVTLFEEICANQDDFNLNLDDASPTTVFPCPPVGGVTIQPQSPLSAFNGQNCNGTWTLVVEDNWLQDGGSLNGWGLKICLSSGSLPVSWLDFTAKRNGDRSVLIQWSTATELNNKLYEVQRSQNGADFQTFGTINAGNGTGVQYYLFNDMKPYSGVNYYRLKQVDKDGKFTYSSIVKVTMPADRTMYTINPNPAVNKTTLTSFTEMKKVNIRLMDATGKLVYTVYKPMIKTGETMDIPVAGRAKGYYLLVIDSENERFTEKIIVQ